MIELDNEKGTLEFKRKISLDQFSKALGQYNKLVRLFGGRDATYKEFTAWLIANDFVNHTPGVKITDEK